MDSGPVVIIETTCRSPAAVVCAQLPTHNPQRAMNGQREESGLWLSSPADRSTDAFVPLDSIFSTEPDLATAGVPCIQ